MNYQGRLTQPNGAPVADGQYKLTFKLFGELTGGTERWYQVMDPVVVRNGVFAVLLGSGNPLTPAVFEGATYLEVQVGDDAALTPRQPIVSVAYAFRAARAAEADSAPVADGAVTTPKLADGAVTAPKLAAQAVTEPALADAAIASRALVSDQASLARVSGGAMSCVGGKVGIGTDNPAEAFDVNGLMHVSGAIGIGPSTPWYGGNQGGVYIDASDPAKGRIQWNDRSDTGFEIYMDPVANTLVNGGTGGGETWGWVSAGSGAGTLFRITPAGTVAYNNVFAQQHAYIGGNLGVTGTTSVLGDLYVYGTNKNRIVKTRDYGERAMYAFESTENRFLDQGRARLRNGVAVVKLDPVFLQTIEGGYLVHLTPYADASLYVARTGRGSFVVKSSRGDRNAPFVWQLSATSKGGKGMRMREVKGVGR